MNGNSLKEILDCMYRNRSIHHMQNDPVSFPRRYENRLDREIAALIASVFAYGAVPVIFRSLEKIFSETGASPRKYVERFDPERGVAIFSGFRHRFNDARDLSALLWGARMMIEDSGSINDFFLKNHDPEGNDIAGSLNVFSSSVLSFDYSLVFRSPSIPSDSYFSFLFPSPASGSACKRLCMFLRWVVRPDDGIDMGLWHGVSPAMLLIPLDTHIRRISSYLGLSSRKTADWKMAREITDALRAFDPEDPVKYDFSLAHTGITEGCDGSNISLCERCALAPVCRQSILAGFHRKTPTLE